MQQQLPTGAVPVSLSAPDTNLTDRAADFLAAGPADARTLVAYVCQLADPPQRVAEHLARAMLGGHRAFVCEPDGQWRLSLPDESEHVEAGESLGSMSYCVVDTETTGTSPDRGDRITEIAVVHVTNGVVSRAFESLVNPQRMVPPRIVALTGISWEMVKDAPTFADIAPQVLDALDGRVFVAHNAAFDWRFVSAEIRRATGRQLGGRSLCTVRLARRIMPQLRSRSLDYVTNFYGVEIASRHRALGDAEATAHVLLRLLGDARGRGCERWDDLERFLAPGGPKKKRTRRPPAMPHPVNRDTTA